MPMWQNSRWPAKGLITLTYRQDFNPLCSYMKGFQCGHTMTSMPACDSIIMTAYEQQCNQLIQIPPNAGLKVQLSAETSGGCLCFDS